MRAATEFNEALETVVATEVFQRAPLMCKVLTYLVDEEVKGRGDKINGYRLAVEGFGRPESFDPATDASIRVEMSRLRRMLARVTATPGVSNGLEIPVGQYRPQLVQQKSAPAANSRFFYAPPAGPGIYVVPRFEMTGPDELQYLASGITSALYQELSKFRELYVTSGVELGDVPEVALRRCIDEFECQFLLRGRLQANLEQLSASVEVVDAASHRQVWAYQCTLNRGSDDLLESLEGCAREIASSLGEPVGLVGVSSGASRVASGASHRWQASDAVLRYHAYRVFGRAFDAREALVDTLKELLGKEPRFAAGWAMLGNLVLDRFAFGAQPWAELDDALAEATGHLERALGMDERLTIGHTGLAFAAFLRDDVPALHDNVERALKTNDNNADTAFQMGWMLYLAGQYDAGERLIARSGLGNHPAPLYRIGMAVIAYVRGDLQEAARLTDALSAYGVTSDTFLLRVVVLSALNRKAEVADIVGNVVQLLPGLTGSWRDELRKWLRDPAVRARAIDDILRVMQG